MAPPAPPRPVINQTRSVITSQGVLSDNMIRWSGVELRLRSGQGYTTGWAPLFLWALLVCCRVEPANSGWGYAAKHAGRRLNSSLYWTSRWLRWLHSCLLTCRVTDTQWCSQTAFFTEWVQYKYLHLVFTKTEYLISHSALFNSSIDFLLSFHRWTALQAHIYQKLSRACISNW